MHSMTLALVALFAGCASPLAGRWQGTADIGPIAAFELQFEVEADEVGGNLSLREPGKPEHLRLCHVERKGRAIALEYDAGRPNCDANGAMPSDRRVLKGQLGEGVITGEVWKGGDKLGFFRAFVAPPKAADAAKP